MKVESFSWARSARPTAWSLEVLRAMEWKRLELVTAAYFRHRGYRAETIDHGPDGGVDVRLFESGSGSAHAIVQCKSWGRRVDAKPVHELAGVMAHEKVKRGIFIGTGGFTLEAKQFAGANRIECVSAERLAQRIDALAPSAQEELLQVAVCGDWTTPSCPSCGAKMALQTRRRGAAQVWRCGACWPRRNQVEFRAADPEEAWTLQPIEDPAQTPSDQEHRTGAMKARVLSVALAVAAIGIAALTLKPVVGSFPKLPPPAKVAVPLPTPQRPPTAAAPAPIPVAPAAMQDADARERQAAQLELKRREAAFQTYFQRSDQCAIEANPTTVACVNEYIRVRRDFEQQWSQGSR